MVRMYPRGESDEFWEGKRKCGWTTSMTPTKHSGRETRNELFRLSPRIKYAAGAMKTGESCKIASIVPIERCSIESKFAKNPKEIHATETAQTQL